MAREKLKRIQGWLQGNNFPNAYEYLGQPRREEIVREIPGDGEPSAIITRNHYGAWVLNTAETMVVDIDFPPALPKGLGEILRAVFLPGFRAQQKIQARECVERGIHEWQARTAGSALRLYRTHSGWRVILIDRLRAPEAEASVSLMRELQGDPLYIRLTQKQKCYRARLTPKPWRIGMSNPPHPFPRETDETRAAHTAWSNAYEKACEGKTTCVLVARLGPDSPDPVIRTHVALHDQFALRGNAPEALA